MSGTRGSYLENWVAVSFQTAAEHELIEERPVTEGIDAVRQRKYAGRARRVPP